MTIMNTITPIDLKDVCFDFTIDSNKFLALSDKDKNLLLNTLSEKEKFENLSNFKLLPNNKVTWSQKPTTLLNKLSCDI